MEHISTMMTSLQRSLLQRHEVLTATMNPIDSPRIAESIRKLKTTLQELHTRNAQLVMRNEKLNLQLSFMPPKMWEVIATATRVRRNGLIIMSNRGLILTIFTYLVVNTGSCKANQAA